MLEEMAEFFDSRIFGYESHQLNEIKGAKEFYPFTSKCLPMNPNAYILDLGCGSGLELDEYFRLNPDAQIYGIDLSSKMLEKFRDKFKERKFKLAKGSFFDIPFGENRFDAAVSVETMHHYQKEDKILLYSRIYLALKKTGYLILTDYFADSDETEQYFMSELTRLKEIQEIHDENLYHYDTPLTVAHEQEALIAAGFSSAEVLKSWGATYTIKAVKIK